MIHDGMVEKRTVAAAVIHTVGGKVTGARGQGQCSGEPVMVP